MYGSYFNSESTSGLNKVSVAVGEVPGTYQINGFSQMRMSMI